MPGSATSSFTDAEEYRAELRDIFPALVVATPGAFTARATRTTLGHLHLLRALESLPRVAFVSLPPDRIFISFSSDPANPLVWRGLTLEPGEIMLHARGERLHQRTLGPCCWGLIALTPESLAAACERETGTTRALPELGRILRPSPRNRSRLLRMHEEAARLAETKPHILGHAEVVRAMDQEIEGALMACLTNGEVRPETNTSRHASAIMARLEDMLGTPPYPKLHLAELSRESGVSTRMMHTYCLAFLGLSPQRYTRLRRLHLVHASILRAGGEGASVAELARQAGFTEPGRFAGHYGAVFGEAPSATLRRVRNA